MSSYGTLAPLYDGLTSDVNYEDFASFYEDIFKARSKNVKTILDVACGTGTLSLILAKKGYELISTDASSEMLNVAREKCYEVEGIIQPLFLLQSMTELDLFGTVDAAISCLDAVNYLPPEDMECFFKLLHLFIEPDGIFIFDINSPQRFRDLDGFTSVDEDETKLCLWRADFDEEEKALYYGMDIFTKLGKLWKRSFEEHVEYAHEPEELKSLLEKHGFINIDIIIDGPQKENKRLFIVAENTAH